MNIFGVHMRRQHGRLVVPKYGHGRHGSILPLMLLTACIFFLGSFAFSAKELPDYEAYERIYEIGGLNFALASTELLFVAVNLAGNIVGFDYEQFRTMVLLMSMAMLSFSLLRVERWLRAGGYNPNFAKLPTYPLIAIFTVAALFVFFLEFFQIRIRAGLALSIMSIAFSVYLTARRRNRFRVVFFTFLLLICGYGAHASTTIILGYFLFFPFLCGFLYLNFRPLIGGLKLKASIFVLVMAASMYLISLVSAQSELRGEQLVSPLNVFRLLCLSIIPIVYIALDYALAKKNESRLDLNSRVMGLVVGSGHGVVASRRLSWIYFSTLCYFSLAAALLVFYVAGFIDEAGEAIVRVFTLNSVSAIFVILLGPSRYLRVWLFLLLSNSLFFLHTLTASG